jgi:hypothetical protein
MNKQEDQLELDLSAGNTSAFDPEVMFQGNLLPQNFYQAKNSKTMSQRHSNIEKIRRTSRLSSNSFIAGDNTKGEQYKTLKQFLDDMFTEQFVTFTNNVKRLNS